MLRPSWMCGVLRCMKDRRLLDRHHAVWGWFVGALLTFSGCSPPPEQPAAPKECVAGELKLPDGRCQPAGLPLDMQCPPGELALADGKCQPAGVPPEACGVGFLPDGKQGCEPVLPAEECPFGTMAVPGETECREVAPCGEGTWGDIPVEANTEYVDQAYPGVDSDGSMAKPWKTIQEGVYYADKGAIVAVAAGTYAEDVTIQYKSVRLWGRCPGMVEVAGAGVEAASILVYGKQASGTEVRGMAMTGLQSGFALSGATEVELDSVWIHDAEYGGLYVIDEVDTSSVRVRNSLLEANHGAGIWLVGSSMTIDKTVVRSTYSSATGLAGNGIQATNNAQTKSRTTVTVRMSVLEGNQEAGIAIGGSDAIIESTVIRRNLPNGKGQHGTGIGVQPSTDKAERANVVVRASVIEQNHYLGISVTGSDSVVENTVIRGTQADFQGQGGLGIQARGEAAPNVRATLIFRGCLVEANVYAGISIGGSDATIEGTIVRATAPHPKMGSGAGIVCADLAKTQQRGVLTVRGCVVEDNLESGVQVEGSTATIDTTVVRLTKTNTQGQFGFGISTSPSYVTGDPSNVDLRTCLIEKNHTAGMQFGVTNTTIESTVVRETAPSGDGRFGDGIVTDLSIVSLRGALVTSNARAGIANFRSEIMVSDSTIRCNAFNLEGESFEGVPFTYAGSTGWACTKLGADDCTVLDECSVQSSGLEPPPPPPPLPF